MPLVHWRGFPYFHPMTTALITHPSGFDHITPSGHPERVKRLEFILAALKEPEFADLAWTEAPKATDAQLLLAHPQAHLDAIKAASPDNGTVSLDPDTHMSPGSLIAAYHSAGATLKAVDMVLGGAVQNAFSAMRPPGHHAEKTTAMGFCLFGNISIAAKHALENHGLKRVAIVDFDVHHGNGTQNLLWDDDRVLFFSSHQMPCYPGSGAASETGAHGNIHNIPLEIGTAGDAFRRAYTEKVLPQLRDFDPELILISAGFDAHKDDPLAQLNLVEDDFIWVTNQLCDVADSCCRGRVVSTLEGGYDLAALAASTAAHVKVLMERGA